MLASDSRSCGVPTCCGACAAAPLAIIKSRMNTPPTVSALIYMMASRTVPESFYIARIDGGRQLNAVCRQAYAFATLARGDEAMGFQLHTRKIDRVVVVEAVGRLTLTDGHTKLRDLMHVSVGDGAKKFIFNFAQVEFIDSFGIGELARCYSIVRRAGGDVKLASVSQRV